MKRLLNTPWKTLLSQLRKQVTQDSLLQAGAALGFFAMLSLFPLLIFLLSAVAYAPIEGLDSAIMGFFDALLPKQGARLIEATMQRVVHNQRPNLLSFGLIGTAWFASSAMHSAMVQLDKTFGLQKPRPFLKARLMSIALTFILALLALAAISLMVLAAKLQGLLITRGTDGTEISLGFAILRWVMIIGFLTVGFGVVYFLGPAVRQKFAWVSPGAIVGVTLLVLASLGFRLYVRNFANYQMVYGALGTVVVLMLWLYVCALALLVGSEVNVALAAQSSSPGGTRTHAPQSEPAPARA